MFSCVISKYGLFKPIISICLVPVKASEKLKSIDGFVSKLSAKLQQAAFSNSSAFTVNIFVVDKNDF